MFDTGFGPDDIEILDRARGFDGYFAIDIYRFRHRLFAGGWSDTIRREIFERGHAVAVLPYDPRTDRVLLLRQIRLAALLADCPPWQIEPVAGIVDTDDGPEAIARRESREEAGIEVTDLWHLFRFLASAGGSSESVELYIGRADLEGAGGLHGLDHEGEDIEAATASLEEAYALIEARRLQNTPAIMGLQWLMLNRERVRAAWR